MSQFWNKNDMRIADKIKYYKYSTWHRITKDISPDAMIHIIHEYNNVLSNTKCSSQKCQIQRAQTELRQVQCYHHIITYQNLISYHADSDNTTFALGV